jgi:hypothetical protein
MNHFSWTGDIWYGGGSNSLSDPLSPLWDLSYQCISYQWASFSYDVVKLKGWHYSCNIFVLFPCEVTLFSAYYVSFFLLWQDSADEDMWTKEFSNILFSVAPTGLESLRTAYRAGTVGHKGFVLRMETTAEESQTLMLCGLGNLR